MYFDQKGLESDLIKNYINIQVPNYAKACRLGQWMKVRKICRFADVRGVNVKRNKEKVKMWNKQVEKCEEVKRQGQFSVSLLHNSSFQKTAELYKLKPRTIRKRYKQWFCFVSFVGEQRLRSWYGVYAMGVRIPAGVKDFSLLQNVQTGSGVNQASYFVGTGVLSRALGVKLTIHLHLLRRLGMNGFIRPLLLYAFRAWTEKTLTFT